MEISESRDKSTRKGWVLPIKDRKDVPMERRSGSLIAMHTLEFKSEAKQWQKKNSIHVQTSLYLTSEWDYYYY
jgi:hypothetical protein